MGSTTFWARRCAATSPTTAGACPHADAARRARRRDAAQPRPWLAVAVPDAVLSRHDGSHQLSARDRLADGAACAAIYGPYVAETAISFELDPADGRRDGRAHRQGRSSALPWVVVEVDGVVRGYAYGTRHRDRRGVRLDGRDDGVRPPLTFAGRGLGGLAMRALIAVLRLQGFHLAGGRDHAPNPGRSRSTVARVRAHRRVRGDRLEAGPHGTAWSGTGLDSGSRGRPRPDPVPPMRPRSGDAGARGRARGPRGGLTVPSRATTSSVTTNALRQRSTASAAWRERFGIAELGLAAGLGGRVIEMAGDPDLRVRLGGDRQAGRGMDGHEQSRSPDLSRISRCLQAERRACEPGRLRGSRAVGLAAAEPGRIEGQRGIAVAGDGVATGILLSRDPPCR